MQCKSDTIGDCFRVSQWHRGIFVQTNHARTGGNDRCKMGLTRLHLYICRSLFGHSSVYEGHFMLAAPCLRKGLGGVYGGLLVSRV